MPPGETAAGKPKVWQLGLALLLEVVGAAGSLAGLQILLPPQAIAVAAVVLTSFWWFGFARPARVRIVRLIGKAVSSLHHAGALYFSIAFGGLLGWTTPPWLRGLVLAMLAASVVPLVLRRGPRLVPLMLPLGLWVGGSFEGWFREDAAIRCDDYRRVLEQPGVHVLVDSTHALETCQPGQVLRVERYPRRVWESPDSTRFLVGTQPGRLMFPVGDPVPSRFTGSLCEIAATGAGEPSCFGMGRVQVFLEDPPLDRLFVAAWSQPDPRHRGLLWELPRSEPARVLREQRFELNVGEGYIDPGRDILVLQTDEGDGNYPVRPSTMEVLPTLPGGIVPGMTRYDPSRNEGVFCGGDMPDQEGWGVANAFEGWPLRVRKLGTLKQIGPLAFTMSWGCDWDPVERSVFVASPNLGTFIELDYDTGRFRSQHVVGFGIRDLVYDKARQRLYLVNYLNGSVMAVDRRTGRRLQEWFAGRFVRFVTPSRDGRSLLIASNVGVLRIDLDPAPAGEHRTSGTH